MKKVWLGVVISLFLAWMGTAALADASKCEDSKVAGTSIATVSGETQPQTECEILNVTFGSAQEACNEAVKAIPLICSAECAKRTNPANGFPCSAVAAAQARGDGSLSCDELTVVDQFNNSIRYILVSCIMPVTCVCGS
jgi:hypothetical protein